jgi:hypothetical protein
MKNKIERYIDSEIIADHAFKSFRFGYSIDIETLSKNEKENFLDFLFENDPVTKEIILNRMQELVEMRLPRIEAQERYDSGLKPHLDAINGEVIWTN